MTSIPELHDLLALLRGPAAERLCLRCQRQQLIERAAFIGLDMREGDIAQLLDRHKRSPHRAGCGEEPFQPASSRPAQRPARPR